MVFVIHSTRHSLSPQTYDICRMEAHKSILARQFSKPSAGSTGLLRDGYSDFFNYSTGRRNVASLHVIFSLRPYHDLVQLLFQFVRGMIDVQYNPKDDLELDFKLFPEALPHDFVWAIVAKDKLRTIKDNRWDLVCISVSVCDCFPNVKSRLYLVQQKILFCLLPFLSCLVQLTPYLAASILNYHFRVRRRYRKPLQDSPCPTQRPQRSRKPAILPFPLC